MIILKDIAIDLERKTEASCSNIVVKDHEEKKCLVINVTITREDNIYLNEMAKLFK